MLRKFLALSNADRLLLVQAALWLPLVGAGLRVTTYSRVRAALGAVPTLPVASSVARDRVGWAVAAADARVPGDRACLERALVAEALLRRRGHGAALRFGVDGADPDMEAHAWVESGDQVVVGGENREAYTRLEAADSG